MTSVCENRAKRYVINNHRINLPSLQRTLINRNYAKLWYGQAVSAIGDTVFGTTLVLWVSQVLARGSSWAPAAVSGILVSAGAAVALVGPVAGVFADRWHRKSTMMRTEVIRAAMVAGLTGLSFVPVRYLPLGLWLGVVYLIVFALNASGQFFIPARFTTIGDVVHGEANRARAAGLAEATTSAAGIIGAPIAALLLLTVGFQWALAVNAASYAVSYLAIRFLRLPPESRPRAPAGVSEASLRAEFSVGLRLFARNRFLVTLLTVTMICQVGTGAINALNVFFVTRDLHASSRLFGFAETAVGVGFIVGALASGRIVRWIGARALTWSGLLATGVLAAGYALQRSFPRRPGHAGDLRHADRDAEHSGGAADPGRGAARVPGPGDGGVRSGQPARVHALGGHLRLAGEHRPAELSYLVRRYQRQLGQPDLHRRRRPDLHVRHPRVRGPARDECPGTAIMGVRAGRCPGPRDTPCRRTCRIHRAARRRGTRPTLPA
jgi:MFS family permease